jgi:hypothetical protein
MDGTNGSATFTDSSEQAGVNTSITFTAPTTSNYKNGAFAYRSLATITNDYKLKIAPWYSTRALASKTVTANGDAKVVKEGLGKVLTNVSNNAKTVTTLKKFGDSSGFFNGTSSYLSMPSYSDFSFSTDITVECWIYLTSATTSYVYCHDQDATSALMFYVSTTNAGIFIAHGGNTTGTASFNLLSTIPLNVWNHVAFQVRGTSFEFYLNGVYQNAASISGGSISFSGGNVLIGTNYTQAAFSTGYMDEYRVSKGIRYNGNFTPSTSAFTTDAITILLVHFDGADQGLFFSDDSSGLRPKLGTGMANFDGTGDTLTTPDSDDFFFGTGPFTISSYVRFATVPTAGTSMQIIGQVQDGNNYWVFQDTNTGGTHYMRFISMVSATSVDVTVAIAAPVANVWYHWAVVRTGNVLKFFLDGVQQGSDQAFNTTMSNNTGVPTIGNAWNGHLDELEVAKGIARYTANFTPPTTELIADNYTALLLHMNGSHGATSFPDDTISGVPLLSADVRYPITAPLGTAKELVTWVEHETDTTASAYTVVITEN